MTDLTTASGIPSFEDFKQENGITFWWASDLMVMLGYQDMKSFQKVLDRTTKSLLSLGISHYDNIVAEQRQNDGTSSQDFKLTRFACYLSVMNADAKKQQVAQAQAYFAIQTRRFELSLEDNHQLERLAIREELVEGQKSLASTAKQSGIQDFAAFQNAGYVGMYNQRSWQLEKSRSIPKGKLMDYMGRTELAANLFRITQTEERIRNKGINGQSNLEQTHYQVGKEVRGIVEKNTGKPPEHLPQEKQLSDVKKEIKQGHKKMLKNDTHKKPS